MGARLMIFSKQEPVLASHVTVTGNPKTATMKPNAAPYPLWRRS
jgi:hypothetical protein